MKQDILSQIVYRDTFNRKMNRLSSWEQFIVCLWLMGWTHQAIAEHAGITKSAISNTFVQAKKKLGVYYQLESEKNG